MLKCLLAGTGLAAALGSGWVYASNRRSARFLRSLISDARRSPAPAPHQPTPAAWPDNQITLSWLGHATVLLNFYGLRILTDPVFSERVGMDVGIGTAGPKRYVTPALALTQLPPVDVILLSHAHYDHMDLPSLRQFPPATFTVTAKVTRDILAASRLQQITELGWNERVKFGGAKGGLEIEAVEVKHWGHRWPDDTERGYNGYVLRREGRTILFGGDTAMTPLFAEHRTKGPFELAILPIAAYDPWIRNHCTPEQAVEMANQARAKYILPVHHETFKLSDEPMNEPIERFVAALQQEPQRIALRQVGETFICP
jgi:L-ascorbate metabolism protein UlaG (beta-lactamase superfamily)